MSPINVPEVSHNFQTIKFEDVFSNEDIVVVSFNPTQGKYVIPGSDGRPVASVKNAQEARGRLGIPRSGQGPRAIEIYHAASTGTHFPFTIDLSMLYAAGLCTREFITFDVAYVPPNKHAMRNVRPGVEEIKQSDVTRRFLVERIQKTLTTRVPILALVDFELDS